MATPPSDDTRVLFKLISDGEWHQYEKVRDAVAEKVPPGRALRKYEERIEYKRRYKNDPEYDTGLSEDERIHLGAKACAQIVITSWKGRGIHARTTDEGKQIRIKPGFKSWGLEAEGVPAPAPGDSEPSEAPGEPSDEPAEAESVAAEPASQEPAVLHPSHKSVFDEYRRVTNCKACGLLVVSAGEYGGVTPEGRELCRAAAEQNPILGVPSLEIIPPAESEFTLKMYSPEGNKSLTRAIARAHQNMSLREQATAMLTRTQGHPRTVWDPQERRVRPITEQESAAGPAEAVIDEEPAPTAAMNLCQLGSDAEIGESLSATEEPVVTEGGEDLETEDALPEPMHLAQEAEMALFRESEVRHLIQVEIAKALDTFQVGMEQYLSEQFDQLSQQIAALRAVRGSWVYHPLKE